MRAIRAFASAIEPVCLPCVSQSAQYAFAASPMRRGGAAYGFAFALLPFADALKARFATEIGKHRRTCIGQYAQNRGRAALLIDRNIVSCEARRIEMPDCYFDSKISAINRSSPDLAETAGE